MRSPGWTVKRAACFPARVGKETSWIESFRTRSKVSHPTKPSSKELVKEWAGIGWPCAAIWASKELMGGSMSGIICVSLGGGGGGGWGCFAAAVVVVVAATTRRKKRKGGGGRGTGMFDGGGAWLVCASCGNDLVVLLLLPMCACKRVETCEQKGWGGRAEAQKASQARVGDYSSTQPHSPTHPTHHHPPQRPTDHANTTRTMSSSSGPSSSMQKGGERTATTPGASSGESRRRGRNEERHDSLTPFLTHHPPTHLPSRTHSRRSQTAAAAAAADAFSQW